jgi:hypothetical protein
MSLPWTPYTYLRSERCPMVAPEGRVSWNPESSRLFRLTCIDMIIHDIEELFMHAHYTV